MTSLLDALVLITSCVWCVRNAVCKYHVPDLALVTFIFIFTVYSFTNFLMSWIYPLDNIFLVKHMLDRMFNASVFVLCLFVTMVWRLLSRRLMLCGWAVISGGVVANATGIIQGVKQARLSTTRYLQLNCTLHRICVMQCFVHNNLLLVLAVVPFDVHVSMVLQPSCWFCCCCWHLVRLVASLFLWYRK
jgi:hypothetical protein